VLGLGGDPVDVLGWQFIRGSATLLALTFDRSLLLVDPTGAVSPLGQFLSLDAVSPDGLSVTLTDALAEVSLTLATGEVTRLAPSPVAGRHAFQGATAVLANGDRIQKVVVPDDTGRRFSSLLVYDDGTSARVLYQTPGDAGSISDFSVSPNGQYVAVETVPDVAASVSDGYFLDARATTVTTALVDIDTGAQTRSVEGFALRW
jgi:dipeptidyl aminopeptidase/acylaminoacyl peptidase